MCKKILIVDDHAVVRRGLRDLIEEQPGYAVCGEAESRVEALQQCEECLPDLALVDLSLGADSGLDLVKDICAQFPSVKLLVLSMQDELLYAERVLRAGASGYIGKGTDPENLMAGVRCVLDGEVYASEAVHQKIMKSVQTAQTGGDPIEQLSDRELAVFERIGSGRKTADIAEEMRLSVKTVETYRARIKTKLNLSSSTELTRRAVQWVLSKSG